MLQYKVQMFETVCQQIVNSLLFSVTIPVLKIKNHV